MIRTENAQVYLGSNLDILPTLPDNSVDAIVTDPPYELGFMGKSWDSSGIAYSVELWRECLRVLKPGGHLLAFSGSRTYHRMVVAIEDSGFEIRDMVSWISNKTFPKSMDVSKAIDKAAGAERKVVGINPNVVREAKVVGGSDFGGFTRANPEITEAATDEAKKWAGWGTALKPTVEPIVMARKPLDGTVANNVLTWGVGGLNIDASRIEAIDQEKLEKNWDRVQSIAAEEGRNSMSGGLKAIDLSDRKAQGRWPANVILDEEAATIIDEQSGITKSPKPYKAEGYKETSMFGLGGVNHDKEYGDEGGASRFFYVARASKSDRNEGVESNPHPTVKPTSLMTYLIKLIAPEGSTILDPFTGSGSTGKAALLNGYKFIGIELTEEYLPIIKGRLDHAEETYKQTKEEETETLF
jgi:site-specific DNA-methyltransferase (adenine-specific)